VLTPAPVVWTGKTVHSEVSRELRKRLEKLRRKHLPGSGEQKENVNAPVSTRIQPPDAQTGAGKRTKYGIRFVSSDGKHFFDFGCWPSSSLLKNGVLLQL
jgi:hypothetical protein